MNHLTIRAEGEGDGAAIRQVNEDAFGREDEAHLVESLRAEGVVLLSLVAQLGDTIVGHVLFSRMWIETSTGAIDAVALAPIAVARRYQRQGIGGSLIRHGLETLRSSGERIVIVVGHPEYYPRFGFSSARARSLESPFPPGPFMALELTRSALDGVRGRVKYPGEFAL